MARIYQANPSITVAKFEKNWDLVSDRLGQLAFIVDHVVPKLFGSETVSLSAKNRLHHIINDAYFRSFTEDLRASVVTDLVYLQYEVTGNGEVDVPFSALVQSCRHHGILEEISICDLAHLIKLESDPRWALAFGDAVRAYSRKSSLRGKTTLKIETLRSFIVHGRDEELLFKLKDYLQNTLKMQEPVVLKQQPNAGRTIIEKFEECSEEVDVALVLLTPDDFGGLEGGVGESRARQNVIYELGYFIGKLGRRSGRVLLLYKGDLQIPSDLLGVCYIAVDKGISAAGEEIRKELTSIK
ncbi:MAG TPA: nucleotide-binding protein [Fimbriimonadaceae bacterium]